jgi:hypothetical protein
MRAITKRLVMWCYCRGWLNARHVVAVFAALDLRGA